MLPAASRARQVDRVIAEYAEDEPGELKLADTLSVLAQERT